MPLDALLQQLYPVWADVPPEVRAQCLQQGKRLQVAAGQALFDPQRACAYFPLLLEGRIKVSKPTPNGRELLLYRVFPGEACVISSVSLLSRRSYGAMGRAETDCELLLLDAERFDALMQQPAFREHIFHLVGDRLTELMTLVEELVTHRLDQRLASLLLGHGQTVRRTHQELADELGTVREMVSRLLKTFQEQGLIALGREKITVLDPGRLRTLSG